MSASDTETRGQGSSSLRTYTCRKAECGPQSTSLTKNMCPVKLQKLKVPKNRRRENLQMPGFWQVSEKCRWKPPKGGSGWTLSPSRWADPETWLMMSQNIGNQWYKLISPFYSWVTWDSSETNCHLSGQSFLHIYLCMFIRRSLIELRNKRDWILSTGIAFWWLGLWGWLWEGGSTLLRRCLVGTSPFFLEQWWYLAF